MILRSYKTRKRINAFSAILVSLFLLLTLFQGVPEFKPALAASGNTVTVHYYNPDGISHSTGYECGLWSWVEGSDGTFTLCANEKSTELVRGSNAAHVFRRTLTSSELSALRSGAKLGVIIIVNARTGQTEPDWDGKSGPAAQKDINSNRYATVALDSSGNGSAYIINGDGKLYNTLETAKDATVQIRSATFTSITAVSYKLTSSASGGTLKVLNRSTGTEVYSRSITSSSVTGAFTLPTIDFSVDYVMKIDGIPDAFKNSKSIDKSQIMKNAAYFGSYETYTGQLGALYSRASTEFRVWAPLASEVKVKLYKSGDPKNSEAFGHGETGMAKYNPSSWSGVWTATVQGDLSGAYYTYAVTNYGETEEIADPYAKAAGVNGDRGMVTDLDATDPEGWNNDRGIYRTTDNYETPIIWEVHVRDFSVHPDSGMKYKGKYLAFTEDNTVAKGDASVKTGINYLKDLGVTYVHLLPVYDFATVDESKMNDATPSKFNWGYDPKNYNVPEGSYSTDPYNGEVRINEFKQMVMALHDAGIGVIMDVVYNHTYSLDSSLNKTVPSYYYRTNAEGNFTNGSGCGNETRSEGVMFRKYMVDSVKYWAEEYHIDGFRFDLMGLHDTVTMNAIRTALDGVDGGGGKKILIYGEPWAAENGTLSSGYYPANYDNVKRLNTRISVFDDWFRDGMRGGNSSIKTNKGFANGNTDAANVTRVKNGISGRSNMDKDGAPDYSYAAPSQNIAYCSAHDNYTLYDQLSYSLHATEIGDHVYDTPEDAIIKRNKIAAAATLTSLGMSFWQAGEEMARVKYGNHNSYNSPDGVNRLDYMRSKSYKTLYDYYKGLIAIRKAFKGFNFSTLQTRDPERIWFWNGQTTSDVIVYSVNAASGASGYKNMLIILNGSGSTRTAKFDGWQGAWKVLAENGVVNPSGIRNFSSTATTASVSAYSAMIMVK